MNSLIKDRLEKIEEGIVPEGYKNTKIGIIPEDWEVAFLESLCNITTGNKDTQDKQDEAIYDFFVRSNTIEKIDSYSYDGEAILTAGDGVGTGKVFHYINDKFDYHQRVYCLNEFKNMNGKFLYYYFSENFIRQVYKYSAKTSVDSVRREMLTKMIIPTPSLEEQVGIANILSTWDKAIENIEKLTKEKEIQKQGLMQELLTGETRLPGFNGEWEEVKLGDISIFIDGDRGRNYPNKKDIKEDGVMFLSTKNIISNKLCLEKIEYISKEKFELLSKGNLKYKDVLITMRGSIGNVALYDKKQDAFINAQLGIIRIEKDLPEFIISLFLLSSNKNKPELFTTL